MGHLCQRSFADLQQAAAGGTLPSSLVRAQVILMAMEHFVKLLMTYAMLLCAAAASSDKPVILVSEKLGKAGRSHGWGAHALHVRLAETHWTASWLTPTIGLAG